MFPFEWPLLVGVALLGCGVGLVAGLFGVGGGFLLTPLLAVVFGVPMPIAIGTGLCQMIGTSTAAFLRHRKLGQGEWRFGVLMLGGSVSGVLLGAQLVDYLESLGQVTLGSTEVPVVRVVLSFSYIVFLLFGALSLMQRRQGVEALDFVRRGVFSRWRIPPLVDLPAVPLSQVSAVVIAYVGLGVGFLSGLLGVGGGIVLLPIMLYGFGFPIRQAAGTGLLVLLVSSVVGTGRYALAGYVDLWLALALLMGSTLFAQVGAQLSHRLSASFLRRGLATVIALTIGLLVWDLVSRWVAAPETLTENQQFFSMKRG